MVKKIIGLTYDVETLDLSSFLKKKRFEFIPGVAYHIINLQDQILNIQSETISHIEFQEPFILFDHGSSTEFLQTFIAADDLSSAKKAYSELMAFVNRNTDRIIADLCCSLILETVEKFGDSDDAVFFFDGPAWGKMIGRLASLSLPKNLTFCFISYRLEQLVTLVMSKTTGRLEFDLHRIINDEKGGPIGPYPGSAEESLIQTYFYRPSAGGKTISAPLRLEIFTQNLLESEIDDKKDIVLDLLRTPGLILPYEIDKNTFTILPKSLVEAIKYKGDAYQKELKLKLIKGDIE